MRGPFTGGKGSRFEGRFLLLLEAPTGACSEAGTGTTAGTDSTGAPTG